MISVIIPTNRINREVFPKIDNIQEAMYNTHFPDKVFTDEFLSLLNDRIDGIGHYLELTLRSLEKQTFDDFELIISHKYPEDALNVVKEYDIPLKLVAEKHSIWHDLGHRYGTLCNNINTGVIQSEGELLWRLDDLTFFNKNVMQELWDNWNDNRYSTSRTIRCIDFDGHFLNQGHKKLGPRKIRIKQGGFTGEYKPLTYEDNMKIPKWMCWGCSSTISIEDYLTVNGHDEVWDGSVCGTDMELGERLNRVSKHNRMATNNLVYEINDIPYKYMSRDDVAFRAIINKRDNRANCWKPAPRHRREYEKWHIENIGELDSNWNKFMDVPYIDMEEEYYTKELGEIVWQNS